MCHKFIFTEILRSNPPQIELPASVTLQKTAEPTPAKATDKTAEPAKIQIEFPKAFIVTALEQAVDDSGWAQLGTFGSYLTKLQPDFDSRTFGTKNYQI